MGLVLLNRSQNVLCGMFGDFWKVVNLPDQHMLANVDACYQREGEVGYSTNGYCVIQDLIRTRYQADKVMLFTDVQL